MNNFGTKIALHRVWLKILGKIHMKFFALFILVFTLNIHAQEWQVVGEMPHPVYGGKAIATDSLIYIIGGFSEKENSRVDLIQAYNPRTNSWYNAANLNEKRSFFVADKSGDSIIVAGGLVSSTKETTQIEIWNMKSPPYILKSDSVFKRSYAAGNVVGNSLYLFGGTIPGSSIGYVTKFRLPDSKILYNTNPSTVNLPLYNMCSTVRGNTIYLFGGVLIGLQKFIYSFDTSTGNFDKLGTHLNVARAGAAAVTDPFGNIYIIGGFSETKNGLSSVEILKFNNNDNETEDGPDLNYSRKDLMAAVFNGSIYVFGGTDRDDQPVSQIERLPFSATTVVKNESSEPVSYKLFNNYPNPFNPSTSISFSVPKSGLVTLKIYNVLGNLVKTIASGNYSPGNYKYIWNGEDESNNKVSSGIYICRLRAENFSASKKMVLLK